MSFSTLLVSLGAMKTFDYIIIGSGIAGLYTALLAKDHGSVAILTKGNIDDCNTMFAQGGIAAAISSSDSPELHMEDTLAAGAGLCEPQAVRILTEDAPERIDDLVRMGVPFDTVNGEIALAREGAHTTSRVLHAGGDATGRHIELTLANLATNSSVSVFEHARVTRLLVDRGMVRGAEVLDSSGQPEQLEARFVVLATGGAGNLYLYTTNPATATGDGVALAFQAGAELVDMEFYQFHPTALRLPDAPAFLISEAVRGEGAVLRGHRGEPFMDRYHPLADLAPRDVVSRAIVQEMEATQQDHVLLDVTHLASSHVVGRFPSIYRFCLEHGLDITTTPIPVAPAAHYMMGGVKTNTWGETNIPGLYACGEVASCGVHGANRLASNSLMETVVFGKRVVQRTLGQDGQFDTAGKMLPESHATLTARAREHVSGGPPTLLQLQRLMWSSVGIVRERAGLEQAAQTLSDWQRALPTSAAAEFELASLIQVTRLVAEAALLREESRGAHYRSDIPEPSHAWEKRTVLTIC